MFLRMYLGKCQVISRYSPHHILPSHLQIGCIWPPMLWLGLFVHAPKYWVTWWFHMISLSYCIFESQGCLTFVFLKAHQFQCVAVWSHLRYNDSDYCSMIWLLLLSKRYATSVELWRKQKNFLSHDCKWFIAKKSNSPHLMILISHWQKPKNNN